MSEHQEILPDEWAEQLYDAVCMVLDGKFSVGVFSVESDHYEMNFYIDKRVVEEEIARINDSWRERIALENGQ